MLRETRRVLVSKEKMMLIKSLGIALLLSLLANAGLFAYLSVVQGQKKAIQGELTLCQGVREQVQKSLEKQRELCAVKDKIISETISEQSKLEKGTDDVISKIDLLLTIPQPKIVRESNENTINIDSLLPPDVVGLLKEHCIRSKGSACTLP